MLPTLKVPDTAPWRLELVIVARSRRSSTERMAISRDVQRGLLIRVGPGAYTERMAFEALTPEGRHLVRMRALRATTIGPLVFSHFSAAVLHGLPVLRTRLDRVHVTVEDEDDRHRTGIAHHFFALDGAEGVQVGELTATALGRTIVDVAGAAPFEETVMAADAALRRGLPRAALWAAVDLAGERRSARRISDTVAFAHPGAESAAESRTRVTGYRLGVEVPELQREFRLSGGGSAFADTWFPHADAVLEVDGDGKYLDAVMAPAGAGRVVLAEKRREDEIRAQVRAFGRIGWVQAGSTALLRPVLGRIGVRPTLPRTSFRAYCDAAADARPR